jgi:Fe-S-cluster containining protein
MNAKDAIPILEEAIEKLESMEPTWKNCKACPNAGKCCDGAPIIVFQEEWDAIAQYLKAYPKKLAYAADRFEQGKECYFHDPNATQCLIHEVRPLNCRWTPYTIMAELKKEGPYTGWIRYKNCEFIKIKDYVDKVTPRPPYFLVVEPANGVVRQQIFLHLQGIKALHPLLKRNEEMVKIRDVFERLMRAP